MIILFYGIAFVKTRRSNHLKRSFRSVIESSFISADISLSFMFTIIKNREKSIYDNEILRFLDVTSKLKVKIVIYNIKLIFNESHFYIFNWFQDLLSIFSRFSSKNCVSHDITLIKNSIDNYRNRFFEFINQ